MRFFIALMVLLASASAAPGLNWEGHDEWMTEMPAAMEYDQSHPEAEAKGKLKPCVEPTTPYDQIPLPGRNCTDAVKSQKKMPEKVK